MALADPLQEFDDQFLQCAICLGQLREPKILPCLHHYCRSCIEKIVKKKGKKVECPICREKHTLAGGADSLKTDFNIKNIIEFIQSQKSVKSAPLKVCAACSQKARVTSFCFQCNDFLCQSCGERHRTSRTALSVQDHRYHIYSLSDLEAAKLTMADLSSLVRGPRCRHHEEKKAELCCTSCDNLPICVPCTHGEHQDHDVKEVSFLAGILRGKLEAQVKDLLQYKVRFARTRESLGKAFDELCQQLHGKIANLEELLAAGGSTLEAGLGKKGEDLKRRQNELSAKLERMHLVGKRESDGRKGGATGGHDATLRDDRRKAEHELKELQREIGREKKQSQQKLHAMKNASEMMLRSVKTQEVLIERKKKEMLDTIDDLPNQLELSISKTASILDIKRDWTDVRCIPKMCSFLDGRIKEIRGKVVALEMMPGQMVAGIPPVPAIF